MLSFLKRKWVFRFRFPLTYFVALDVSLAGVSLPALAGHCPPRQGVVHPAVGVLRAGLDVQAGVLALLLDAGLLARALAVRAAANLGDGRRDWKS